MLCVIRRRGNRDQERVTILTSCSFSDLKGLYVGNCMDCRLNVMQDRTGLTRNRKREEGAVVFIDLLEAKKGDL